MDAHEEERAAKVREIKARFYTAIQKIFRNNAILAIERDIVGLTYLLEMSLFKAIRYFEELNDNEILEMEGLHANKALLAMCELASKELEEIYIRTE